MTSFTTPGPALRPLSHPLGPHLQLWRVDLDAYPAQYGLDGLGPDERQRAERMAFAHLSRRSLASRHVLRRLLGEALGRSPQALGFVVDRFGKPALAGGSPLAFSVSHREQHGLIGLYEGDTLGVDIELQRPMDELESLARACFTAREWQAWRALEAHARLPSFFECWTRKEACVKALGLGMSAPLVAIDVGSQHVDDPALEVHSLRLADAPAGLVAACAWTDAGSVARAHAAWG